ncbi:MAG: methyl-accepting chemotaxis protein [Synergistaceae bacterium]|nr:methyl-accepting chemotaxis protein [Synergistaceae bacterium]
MKLILSFSVIILINIFFGLYSMRSLYIVNGRVIEANGWTEGISQLGDLQFNVVSVRRFDLNYIQQRDADHKKDTLQRRANAIKIAEEIMNGYRNDVLVIPYDAEEQRQEDLIEINTIISNWKAYLEISNRLLDESDAGNYINLLSLINGESMTSFETLEVSVEDLVTFNKEGSLAVMKASNELYRSMERAIAVILILVTVFSVVVPILLVRDIKRSVNELLRVSEAVGEGMLTVSANVFTNDEFGKLASQYNHTIANIKVLVSHMQRSASYMAGASEDFRENASQSSSGTDRISQSIEQVSLRSDKQREEIESIMTSVNGMAGGIVGITDRLDTMAQGAAESVRISNEGGEFMRMAVSQMKMIESAVNISSEVVTALVERTNEIGRIVGIIADISNQTNLIALNAAIEAARAGDLGRGFAVVAEEVEKLAKESRTATEEISRLISSIQKETSHAVEAMANGKEEARKGTLAVDDGGHSFDALAKMAVRSSEGLTGIASLMHEMSSETSSIASAVRNVEDLSSEIARDSQSIVAETQEQAASMQEVSRSSQELARISVDMLDSAKRFSV